MPRLGPNRTSLERTLEARDLLGRDDLEAQVQLARHLARALDVEVTAPLAGQYRLALNVLLSAPPRVDAGGDVLARLRAL